MACFLVSGGEAIVVTAVRAAVKKSEIAKGVVDAEGNQLTDPSKEGICWTRKLGWLMNMLWGGVILLAIEHMWHGEVVPFPPFLTAMNDPGGNGICLKTKPLQQEIKESVQLETVATPFVQDYFIEQTIGSKVGLSVFVVHLEIFKGYDLKMGSGNGGQKVLTCSRGLLDAEMVQVLLYLLMSQFHVDHLN